MHVTKYSRPL